MEFLNIYSGEITFITSINTYIIIAFGPNISIYNKNNEFINNFKIFSHERITKIKNNNEIVIFIAENQMKYCNINDLFNNTNSNLLSINNFNNSSSDWILDCLIINTNDIIIGYCNNYLEYYHNNKLTNRIFNSDKCLIYSLSIALINNEIIVTSGSIFQCVLIWSFSIDELLSTSNLIINTFLYLKGHLGVIFNLSIINKNKVLSVSDDRTIILWEINNQNYTKQVFIGHTSRVWNALYIEKYNKIVSVGEDTSLRIFSVEENKEIAVYNNHSGKSIRSLFYNSDTGIVYTGGDDGKVFYMNLDNTFTSNKTSNQIELNKETYGYTKEIKIINEESILVGTSKGVVLNWNPKINSIKIVSNLLIDITSLEYNSNCIYVGNVKGELIILNDSEVKFREKIFPFKLSLINFSYCSSYIIVSNPIGEISLISNKEENIHKIHKLSLKDTLKNQLSYSSMIYSLCNSFLLVGDINGKINIIKLEYKENTFNVIDNLPLKLHNKEPITKLLLVKDYLYSSSRDGKLVSSKINISSSPLQLISSEELFTHNLSSIEDFYYDNKSDKFIILGSNGGVLKVYDSLLNTVIYKDDINGLNRVFNSNITKNDFLISYNTGAILLSNLIKNENNVNSLSNFNKISGKIIHSIRVIELALDDYIIITGSEDTNINIYHFNNDKIQFLTAITRHTGSIRHINCFHNDNDNVYFSSAGASSEIFIHKINKETKKCDTICNL